MPGTPRPELRQTLPRSARVRSQRVFTDAFRQRTRVSDRLITIYGLANGLGITRLGISVGQRLGSAVRRNRLKRAIREAFRRIRHQLPHGMDLIVVPRPGEELEADALQVSIRSLAEALQERLQKRRRS